MPGYVYPDPASVDISWSIEDVWSADPGALDFSFAPGASLSFFTIESSSGLSFVAENRHFALSGQASCDFSSSVAWQSDFHLEGTSAFTPETSERAFALAGETNAWFTSNDPGYSFFAGASVASASFEGSTVGVGVWSLAGTSVATFGGEYSSSCAFDVKVSSACAFKGTYNKDVAFVSRATSSSFIVSAAEASASFSIIGSAKGIRNRRYVPTITPVHPKIYEPNAAFTLKGKASMKLVGAHG